MTGVVNWAADRARIDKAVQGIKDTRFPAVFCKLSDFTAIGALRV